jgi:hypothetical protein
MTDTANKTVIDRCCAIVSACGMVVNIWLIMLSHSAATLSRTWYIVFVVAFAALIAVLIEYGRRLRPWQKWTLGEGYQGGWCELRAFLPRWARFLEWIVYGYPLLLLVLGFFDPSSRGYRFPKTDQERIMGLRVASAIGFALYYHVALMFFFVPRDAKPADLSSRGVGDV